MQMLPADELGHVWLPTTIRHRHNTFATLQYHHATVKRWEAWLAVVGKTFATTCGWPQCGVTGLGWQPSTPLVVLVPSSSRFVSSEIFPSKKIF
jgi:hypothetical protein